MSGLLNRLIMGRVGGAMSVLRDNYRNELMLQGHKATGNLYDSVDYKLSDEGNKITGTLYALSYSKHLEYPVKFKGVSRGQIEGLFRWWKVRGLGEKEAMRAAWATAVKHVREGMPTANAYRYSQTGERTRSLATTIDKTRATLEKIIDFEIGRAHV